MMNQKKYNMQAALVLYLFMTSASYVSTQSSFKFPITGNVFPLGYYAVKIDIGDPSKQYVLDIDTGSDLTWITCGGAYLHPSNGHFPKSENIVTCQDPACLALGDIRNENCLKPPDDACLYTVDYADGGTSNGILIRESVPLTFTNGTPITPPLTIGCANIIHEVRDPTHQPIVNGVLGLGKGEPGILKQLSSMSVVRNVVGHCLSGQGGGFLSLGDYFPPTSNIVWKQISSTDEHYSLGSADIYFGDELSDIRDLDIIFDSGSTYTYLNSVAYEALLDLVIVKNLGEGILEYASEDRTLPMCWKGVAPFTSVDNVTSYFNNFSLSFTTGVENVRFEMSPKSYLIISQPGNVCFGILNGTQVGFGDRNLIGDISMHDKLVIYDNENMKVGWTDADCTY